MKECTKCHIVKPETEFYKGRSDCKECKIKKSRVNYAPKKEAIKNKRLESYKGTEKICRICKEVKPLSEFGVNKDHWDNLSHDCKECTRNRNKEFYYRYIEIISLKRKEANKKRREAGIRKPYKWKNIGARKANWHRRQARKRQIGGSFTKYQWELLRNYYSPDGKCIACGEVKPLTADHVIPISKGGRSDIGNIQPICQICNSSKNVFCTDYRFDNGEYAKKLESIKHNEVVFVTEYNSNRQE